MSHSSGQQAPPVEPPLPWGERWSDRFNPILVREVSQALRGRVFMMTLAGSVLAVVMLTFANVWFGHDQRSIGRDAFSSCLMCLMPVVLFVVPFLAFFSMWHEVTGGTAEQLTLTHLTPRRIVFGKLAAAGAQFVLFLAVFAPVVALTFVLRGVDVPTIAIMLFFAVLASLAATVVAVALAAVARWKHVGVLMMVVAAAALFIGTMFGMVGAWELPNDIGWLMRQDEMWAVLWAVTAMFGAGIVLFAMIASAALSHAYENRSTPFRLFAVGGLLVAYALLAWNVPTTFVDEVFPGTAAIVAIATLPIWLYACCEETTLSPRVRTLVPKSRLLAWLTAPLLPGGGRGLLFTWVFGALTMALGVGLPLAFGTAPDGDMLGIAGMSWCYVVLYGALGRGIRSRLASGPARSFTAFVATLFVLVVVSLVPLFTELMLSGGRSRWSPVHIFNPFYTIAENHRWHEHKYILPVLGAMALVAMGACAVRVKRDTREVIAASDARRALAAKEKAQEAVDAA